MVVGIFQGEIVVTLLLKLFPPGFRAIEALGRRQFPPLLRIQRQHSPIALRKRLSREQQTLRDSGITIHLSEKKPYKLKIGATTSGAAASAAEWRFADTAFAKFGEVVDGGVIANPNTFVSRDAPGLARAEARRRPK